MEEQNKYASLDQWLKLSREEQLRTVFACPPTWRRRQVQHLWGHEALGYDHWASIPSWVPWEEMAKVIISGNCSCSVTMKVKREYISQINEDEYHKLVEQENKTSIYNIDLKDVNRNYYAFSSWRRENRLVGKEYIFTVEKYDDNTLLFLLCIDRGSNGDEDGFGIEPDMWTSALFDLKGNIVQHFRPGIISPSDVF